MGQVKFEDVKDESIISYVIGGQQLKGDTKDLVDRIVEFYEKWEMYHEVPVTITRNGKTIEKMQKEPNTMPSQKELAKHLNIPFMRLEYIKKRSRPITSVIEVYEKTIYKQALVEGLALGIYNSSGVQFILKTMFDMEKKSVTPDNKTTYNVQNMQMLICDNLKKAGALQGPDGEETKQLKAFK